MRSEKKRNLGRAIADVCINGILIVIAAISIPVFMKAAERTKQMKQHQDTEQQPRQP